ncbi:FUSC family protein [Streptomyces noursei]|uniref:FUSC family protein n=2 Tax=Streptomyces noursei TaxID=1971 RepID=UPI0022A6FCE6|nr:FUSC family protein [Streptomyces noursei]MCZ1020404.1 FUSC family protein [Streptomyces noursei]
MRVTVAGCTGFYSCRYGLGDPAMGLYAMFGALPLGLFARLPGDARQRAGTLLSVLPVGWALVTLGTALAVNTWAAAVGMVVIGFAVAFCTACGPRVSGVAPALQLFYVLPCFPPYAPQTLLSRLIGLTIGVVLISCAERWIWPEAPAPAYRTALADALSALGHYAATVAAHLSTGARADASMSRCRESAHRAVDAARLSRAAATERPVAPTVHDLALCHARTAARYVSDQLDRLYAVDGSPRPEAAALLRDGAPRLHSAAATLRGSPPRDPAATPTPEALDATAQPGLTLAPPSSPGALRQDAVARAAAAGAELALLASRIAAGGRQTAAQADSPPWYVTTSPLALCFRRLAAHANRRSVHLHNALRIGLALGCARALVGLLALSHGFWVLFAVLSLMRTSAADTRAELRPAFVGTAAGAVAMGLVLHGVGDAPLVYAFALPVAMLCGFGAGPLIGPAWEQAAFTITFVLIFTQLSVPDWHLSEQRLVDVLLGGVIGAVASLLAWPRGSHSTLCETVADFLTAGGDGCRSAIAVLGGRTAPADPLPPVRRAMLRAEAAYAQNQAEKARPHAGDQLIERALTCGYHMAVGGELLLMRHQRLHRAALSPATAEALARLAEEAAAHARYAAADLRVAAGRRSEAAVPAAFTRPDPPHRPTARTGDLAPDAEAWLAGVLQDLARILDVTDRRQPRRKTRY